MQRKKGFTLIELLVVIAIIALLVSILLPSLARARELAKQAVCATRLKGLGTAMAVYAANYNDDYPSLGEAASGGSYDSYDKACNAYQNKAGFYNNEAQSNTSHYYLLVLDGHCSRDQFGCPSDSDFATDVDDPNNSYGFDAPDNQYPSSYALQPATSDPNNAARVGRGGQDGGVVIAGDRSVTNNDGSIPNQDSEKTANHPEDGGNYLTYNSSVSFQRFEEGSNDRWKATFGYDRNYVYHEDFEKQDDGEWKSQQGPSLDLPEYSNDSVLMNPKAGERGGSD
jgi:prepilin-type N-terminal cleavage/methylation domain-containing protein